MVMVHHIVRCDVFLFLSCSQEEVGFETDEEYGVALPS